MAGSDQVNLIESKTVVPLNTWVLISNFKLAYNLLRRPDGTFNRHLAEFLDRKVPANANPVNGVFSFDVIMDRQTNLLSRVYRPAYAGGDPPSFTDLQKPVDGEVVPVIVFFHGGSFVHSSANSAIYDTLCRRLVGLCGSVVVSVNYRRAPENRYPCAYDDGWTALNWVNSRAWLQSKKDSKVHIFLAGDSSGGNIAHNVAVRAVESGIGVLGNILLNPMFGGTERTESETRLDGKYFVTVRDRDWYWRAFLPEGEDREHPACSPFGPKSKSLEGLSFPKSLVVVAGLDLIQDWQLKYAEGLKRAVEFLRQDGNISLIGLWGRSMGAVTSLMYGAEDPSIAGMILDSPFSDLVDLMMELVDTYKFRLPKFTVKFAIQFMRRAIQKKAKFDITDLNTIKVAKSSFVPVLFGHALDDDFIRPHHSDLIYEAYVGDKNIIKFEGDHNSPRPQFYFDSINIFFHNVLRPPEVTGPTFYDSLDEYLAKGSWGTMHDTTIPQSSVQKSLAGSSISEAINEVRVKRPMSRTDVPSNVTSNGSPSETKEKENHDGREDSSSSPDMISFDLSNGDHDQYPPQLAMALDDDQYLEYHLEDIPSNAEEEERMLMKAVMESLKDLEVQSLEKKESPEKRVLGSNSFQTAQEPLLSRKESTSTQANQSETTDSASSPATVGGDVAPSSSESKAPNGTSDSLTAPVDASVPGCTSQNASENGDMSADTKATVTVERTSSAPGKVFDGLIRKWDLNFFKNNK